MDREAWQAIVYGVSKSHTRLKRLSLPVFLNVDLQTFKNQKTLYLKAILLFFSGEERKRFRPQEI